MKKLLLWILLFASYNCIPLVAYGDTIVKSNIQSNIDQYMSMSREQTFFLNSKLLLINKFSVKKQSIIQLSSEERDLLARLIEAEAKGESYEGKIAVGNVVINRINSDLFPNNLTDVIYQTNQFSPVIDGSINNSPSQDTLSAVEDIIYGKTIVPNNILFFWGNYVNKKNWIWTRKIHSTIDNHCFGE